MLFRSEWPIEVRPRMRPRGLAQVTASPTPLAALLDVTVTSRILHPDVSSGAAKIYAASVALNEILHLSYVAEEMGAPMDKPLCIKIDNTAAIAFANGRVRRSKLKHIDVRQEWVQALRDHSVVRTEYVNTKQNKADFFTKILDNETFLNFRDDMLKFCRLPATPAA